MASPLSTELLLESTKLLRLRVQIPTPVSKAARSFGAPVAANLDLWLLTGLLLLRIAREPTGEGLRRKSLDLRGRRGDVEPTNMLKLLRLSAGKALIEGSGGWEAHRLLETRPLLI